MKKKIFLFLLIFSLISFPVKSFCLTRDDLETEIRRLVADTNTDTTKQRWSSGTIVSRIEMAQLDMVSRTRCMEDVAYIDTSFNLEKYPLPSNLLVIKRVAYTTESSSSTVLFSTSSYKKIERYTILGLDNDSTYWESLGVGLPTKYYILGSSICLVPRPSYSYSGSKRLKIVYIPRPESLDDNSDVPFNNYYYLYPYHTIITYYVAMLCFLDERDFNLAMQYRDLYFRSLDLMVKELNSNPDWQPSFKFRNK